MTVTRAEELIQTLRLERHPEGGVYRENFRSPHRVLSRDGIERPALTHIWFLLAEGERTRWHRVAHDEAWHFYEGAPIELLWLTGDGTALEQHALGPFAEGREPVLVIPAGSWQTACSTGAYSLAGCTVSPGFEFEDFALMRDVPEAAETLRRQFPDLAAHL